MGVACEGGPHYFYLKKMYLNLKLKIRHPHNPQAHTRWKSDTYKTHTSPQITHIFPHDYPHLVNFPQITHKLINYTQDNK